MDPMTVYMCPCVDFVCARAHNDDYCTQRETMAATKNNNLLCFRTHNYCRYRIFYDRTYLYFYYVWRIKINILFFYYDFCGPHVVDITWVCDFEMSDDPERSVRIISCVQSCKRKRECVLYFFSLSVRVVFALTCVCVCDERAVAQTLTRRS